MAISCLPDDLAESVKCLDKQDSQALLSQIVWLLCQLNSMECTPETLAESTACLQNVDQQTLLAYSVFLLCQIANGGGGSSPKVYRALLTQSGTDAPVATVLENTLGFVPTYEYSLVGQYNVVSPVGFPAGKTFILFNYNFENGSSTVGAASWQNPSLILLDTWTEIDPFTRHEMGTGPHSIEILVY